jgi:hypothetical protein
MNLVPVQIVEVDHTVIDGGMTMEGVETVDLEEEDKEGIERGSWIIDIE